MEPELIYTDILGLRQIQAAVMNGWIKHKYVRVGKLVREQRVLKQH